MSTIPLSSVDPDPRSAADRVSDYNNSPPPASEHNAGLDKHVSAAVDKLFAAEEAAAAAPMKDLDSLISENLDKHYEAVEDAESFTLSREARDTLAHRYGNQHSLKDTIHAYLGWGKKFREDPQAAGLEFAESYARATPYAKREYKPAKTEVYVDEGGKRYTGAKLSAIIDDAMETSSAEKAAYEATPEERKALKALFPGKKDFREIMETIVKIDSDAFDRPLETAAQLAAGFGLAWTPRQQEAQAVRQNADAHIAHASQYLPGMGNPQLRARMAAVIQSPEFAPYAVGDEQTTLRNAHAVATQQMNHEYQEHQVIAHHLNEIAAADPAIAKQTADVLLHDKDFHKYVGNGIASPVGKVSAALHWARSRGQQAQKAVLSKAKRAMPPSNLPRVPFLRAPLARGLMRT